MSKKSPLCTKCKKEPAQYLIGYCLGCELKIIMTNAIQVNRARAKYGDSK